MTVLLEWDMDNAARKTRQEDISGLTQEAVNGVTVGNAVADWGRPDMPTVES